MDQKELCELDKIYDNYLIEEQNNIAFKNIELIFGSLYVLIMTYYFKKLKINKLNNLDQQTFFIVMHQKIIFYFVFIFFCLNYYGNRQTLNIF